MGIYVRSMKESLVHGVQYLLSTSCFGRMQTHSVQRSNFVDDHAYYQNRSKVSYRAASHKWTCMEDIWWTFSNGYKINGSGIYTVCLSFTERLVLWFLADSYLQMSESNVRINFLSCMYLFSLLCFLTWKWKFTVPCRYKDQSKVLKCTRAHSKGNPAIQLYLGPSIIQYSAN